MITSKESLNHVVNTGLLILRLQAGGPNLAPLARQPLILRVHDFIYFWHVAKMGSIEGWERAD